jgi:gamma-glutamyltranspeptidase/glutathione hydrolase
MWFLAALALTFAAPPEAASGWLDRDRFEARAQMAVTANPLATAAAVEILDAGGTAADAAIAAALVLGVVEPQSSGIGGGGFLLHLDGKTRKIVSYDGRETAPAAATPDLFQHPSGQPLPFLDAVAGGRSVGAPGQLRLLALIHADQGRLPWARLFEPAIRVAEDGFPVSPRMHKMIAWAEPVLARHPEGAALYLPGGAPLPAGTPFRNPALAETLRVLAREGADALYAGPLAEQLVAAVTSAPDNPGRLSLSDLAGYEALRREPVCGVVATWRICGAPPPSGGGLAVAQIVGMLEHVDVADWAPSSPTFAHAFAEASRLAYADRAAYVGDPAFVDVPVERLLAPDYLASRAGLVRADATLGLAPPGLAAAPSGEAGELPATTHLVVADRRGDVVSFTTSVENAFGSGVVVDGYILNNQLTDFDFVPVRDGAPTANRLEPGKRPRSAMSPTIVTDAKTGRFILAIGSPGGPQIIDYVARPLVALRHDPTQTLQDLVETPHICNRNGPTEIERAPGHEAWADATADALRALGHEVTFKELTSGIHGVERRGRALYGAVDPRREGMADGR